MDDIQIQKIDELEEINTQIEKLQESAMEELFYDEENLHRSLYDLYQQKIFIKRSLDDVCQMLRDFSQFTQYLGENIDSEIKWYDNNIEDIPHMIETQISKGNISNVRELQNELIYLKERKVAMLENFTNEINHEVIVRYAEIENEIAKNIKSFQSIEEKIKQIEYQLYVTNKKKREEFEEKLLELEEKKQNFLSTLWKI